MALSSSKVVTASIKQSTYLKSASEKTTLENKKIQRYLSMQGMVFSEDHSLHIGDLCAPNFSIKPVY